MYRFSVWNFFSQLKVKTSHLHKKPQERMYLRSAAPLPAGFRLRVY